MNYNKIKYVGLLIGCLSGIACSGGAGTTTDSGGSTTVTGNVGSANASQTSALVKTLATGCAADTVMATDSSAQSVTASVQDDCSFSISLNEDKSYTISLMANNAFIASMVFDSGISGFSENAFYLPRGTSTFDLGIITFSGSTALCERNPKEWLDRDDDGSYDFEDSDDDGDGVLDEDEDDCDYDGYIDDDDSQSCEVTSDQLGRVVRFKPFRGNQHVHPSRDVRALISCRVNPDTVTADTFRVESSLGEAVSCDYRVSELGHRIECRHRLDPFNLDETYTVNVDGVQCLNGQDVMAAEITFKVSNEDMGEDDSENTVDDESESSDSSSDNSEDDSSHDSNDD